MKIITSSFVKFIIKQKLLFSLFALCIFMLVGIILIPAKNKNTSVVDRYANQTNTLTGGSKSGVGKVVPGSAPANQNKNSSKISDFFSRLFPGLNTKHDKNSVPPGYIVDKSSQAFLQSTTVSSKSKVAQQQSPGSTVTQGSSLQQASNNSSQNTSQLSLSPSVITDVQLIFVDSNGQLQTYVPPTDASLLGVTWLRYINEADGYQIDIPQDWQIVKTQYNGHEGVILYQPTDDINKVNVQSISFVPWKLDYLITSSTYISPIQVRGVPGNVYTKGPMPTSSVAAVFQHTKGYFALGSSSSNSTFLGVFDHMLRSIVFTD